LTVEELYSQSIKPLSAAERLHLATLILNDIPPEAVSDYSDEWTAQDYRDFSQASWNHTQKVLGEEAGG